MRKKIQIDRSKWRTGKDGKTKTGRGETALLNNEKYKCCLGFICEQVAPWEDIELMGEPDEIDEVIEGLTEEHDGLSPVNSELTNQAMSVNDDEETTPQEKETKLTELFKESPYELIFTGEYE